jgi:hypothetical protein
VYRLAFARKGFFFRLLEMVPKYLVIFILAPLVYSSVTDESLLPVGADVATSNPSLNYDTSSSTYVWSFNTGSDIYKYSAPINSPELQTAQLKILSSVNGDSFTPVAAAAPDYYFNGDFKRLP